MIHLLSMRRLGVVALAATLAAAPARAQSLPFTLVGGINLANLSGKDVASNASNKFGILAGVGTEFSLIPGLQLQPEVLFQMQGSEVSGGGATVSVSANYINVPVLLRYTIPIAPGSPVNPFILAGPNAMLRVSCSVSSPVGSSSCQNPVTGKDPSTFDFGLTFGGGIGFKLGGRELTAGLRYMIGLMTTNEGAEANNRALQIVATFKL